MLFLYANGVSTSKAVRIYKVYGDQAIALIEENPYRLAQDIYGIGFLTADTIAQKMGIEKTSLIRAKAGIRYALFQEADHGNCAFPKVALMPQAADLLEIPLEILEQAVAEEIQAQGLVLETIGDEECLFIPSLFFYEKNISEIIMALSKGSPIWGKINADSAIPWVEKKLGIQLADNQKKAVATAINSKFMVVTGGPGVGKTTIVNSIIKILSAKQLSVLLAAPTGRAAKRLSESTGLEAKTIHRLLEFDPAERRFKRDSENPLEPIACS